MFDLKSLHLSVKRMESGQASFCLSWESPPVPEVDDPARPWGGTHRDGLQGMNFYMSGQEFLALTAGEWVTMSDIGYLLRVFGESWTFWNLDCPTGETGTASVPWRRLTVPRACLGRMREVGLQALADYDAQEPTSWGGRDNVRIDLHCALMEYSDHGQGSGKLQVDCSPECADALGMARRGATDASDDSWERCWEHISRIALNTTWAPTDVGVLRVGIERSMVDGKAPNFVWSAGSLYGGLINHGTDDAPDWSLHT